MANYCPECGSRVIDPGATACSSCGADLPARGGLLRRLFLALFGGGSRGDPGASAIQHRTIVNHSQRIEYDDPVTGQRRVADSLDDLPPDVRSGIESALTQARSGASGGSAYTFQDASGVTRTYDSLDEMPPEVRRVFQEARNR